MANNIAASQYSRKVKSLLTDNYEVSEHDIVCNKCLTYTYQSFPIWIRRQRLKVLKQTSFS